MLLEVKIVIPISFLILLLSTNVAGQVDSNMCFYTSTACTCALKPSSGICYRQTSAEMCMPAQCMESWKCDCFAPTHICSRNPCSKLEPLPNAIQDINGEIACNRTMSPQCASPDDIVAFPSPSVSPVTAPIASPVGTPTSIPMSSQQLSSSPNHHEGSTSPSPGTALSSDTTDSPSPSPSPSPC